MKLSIFILQLKSYILLQIFHINLLNYLISRIMQLS